jgi:hypothetical protein
MLYPELKIICEEEEKDIPQNIRPLVEPDRLKK